MRTPRTHTYACNVQSLSTKPFWQQFNPNSNSHFFFVLFLFSQCCDASAAYQFMAHIFESINVETSRKSTMSYLFSLMNSSAGYCSMGFNGIRRKFELFKISLECMTSPVVMSGLTSQLLFTGSIFTDASIGIDRAWSNLLLLCALIDLILSGLCLFINWSVNWA